MSVEQSGILLSAIERRLKITTAGFYRHSHVSSLEKVSGKYILKKAKIAWLHKSARICVIFDIILQRD